MNRLASHAVTVFGPKSRQFATALLVACLLGAGPGLCLAAAAELRTWTDASGKFKIKAKFVSLTNGVVTLENEDGTELEIELKKLSAADQKAANDAVKAESENPFKTAAPSDPFKTKTKGSKPVATTRPGGKNAVSSTDAKMVKVNWTSVSRVTLNPPRSGGWQVALPKVDEQEKFEPATTALPSKSNFFEKLKGVAISRVANKAAVGFVLTHGEPKGISRVVLCDLKSGDASEPATATGQMSPLALHDDGEQIVMRRDEFGFGNQDRLEVWTLDGGNVSKNQAWVPYDDVKGPGRDVAWAEFLDGDRLVTCSRGGIVVVWKFPEIRPMMVVNLVDGVLPALSPDRKLLAYSTGADVGLFDLTKKSVVTQQPMPERLTNPSLAFSPSGKRLACGGGGKIFIWDLATGKLESTIPTAGLGFQGGIDFPDDGFILAGGKYLFDIANQLKLWTYNGPEEAKTVGEWTLFAATDGEKAPGALVPVQVPHPAAREMLKKAISDPSYFALHPGTVVKINVSGIPDAGQQARVSAALARRLQESDCLVGSNGTIELVASVDAAKEREISFWHSGTYKMKEFVTRVKFVYEGQSAWETSGTNVPFLVQLKKGENMEGHLREREKPEYAFFERVELPRYIPKPTGGKGGGHSLTLGQSNVTTAGVR